MYFIFKNSSCCPSLEKKRRNISKIERSHLSLMLKRGIEGELENEL